MKHFENNNAGPSKITRKSNTQPDSSSKVILYTNFFKLKTERFKRDPFQIWQYSVKILLKESQEKESDWRDVSSSSPIEFNRNVFELLKTKYLSNSNWNTLNLAYDGRSIVYTPGKLSHHPWNGCNHKLSINKEGNAPSRGILFEKTQQCKVIIEFVKLLSVDGLIRDGSQSINATEQLTALDVLADLQIKGRVQVGRIFYEPQAFNREKPVIQYWDGFYHSVRHLKLGLALNVEMSQGKFFNLGHGMLLDYARPIIGTTNTSEHRIKVENILTKRLCGVKVRATHTGIIYKIHGFHWKNENTLETKISNAEDEQISIKEYFEGKYNKRLTQQNVPLVVASSRNTLIPMELLQIVKNQKVKGPLQMNQDTDNLKIPSILPWDHKGKIKNTVSGLYSSSPLIPGGSFEVKTEFVTVEGRTLRPPLIEYSGESKKPWGGKWYTDRTVKCKKPGILDKWVVVNCTRNRNTRFINQFVETAKNFGMIVKNEHPKTINSNRNVPVLNAFNNEASQLSETESENKFMLIILEEKNSQIYSKIKHAADLKYGIATQIVIADGNLNQKCRNLILKVNIKLGGQNSTIRILENERKDSRNKNIFRSENMILGADVSHPSGNSTKPSIAALVGSKDKEGVQYAASLRHQPSRQEIIKDLFDMVREVYFIRREEKNIIPNSIIMFRDGVSESQYDEVMRTEVQALKKASKCILSQPKITYIIVTKRHHSRFFTDRNANVKPGTVVDTEIISRKYPEFYLTSHQGITGTSKPSRYTILFDENKFSLPDLQEYVFALTHGFARCQTSVSMVNSAYYAHLLAARGRAYTQAINVPNNTGQGGDYNEQNIEGSVEIPKQLKKILYFI